jgi:pectin methylesterase-like acyl-CoA thioesterase
MLKKITYCFSIIYTYSSLLMAQNFVVAADGSGDFTSIQAAIDRLPDSATEQQRGVSRTNVHYET